MSASSGRSSHRLARFVPLLIACVPLTWLLLLNRSYYVDWDRHLWLIAYTGEYIRRHASFPQTLNTISVVGIPFPVFYGTLFYPIAGLVSAATGAAIALRVVVVALFWLQAAQVTKLVEAVYPSRRTAWAIAALVAFAPYPLTNLYNRNALTELVAVSLLVSACATWLRVIVTAGRPGTWRTASLAWLLLTVSAGSHPITATLGGAAFGLLALVGMLGGRERRAHFRWCAINAALYLIVLSPWVYATLTFQNDLAVKSAMLGVKLWSESIDAWWIRLLPIPFDIRPLRTDDLRQVSTPYLAAQINAGLVITAGFLLVQLWHRWGKEDRPVRARRAATALCLGLSVLAYFGSISETLWRTLPASLSFFQFGYRLVTYTDLFLFGGVVVMLAMLAPYRHEIERPLQRCLTAAVVLMSIGVLVKFTHAAAIQRPSVTPGFGVWTADRDTLRRMPAGLPFEDYRVDTGYAGTLTDATVVKLPIGVRTKFGMAETTVLSQQGNITTNIEAFPWNRVVLDARELPMPEVYTTGSFLSLVVPASAGREQHALGYRFSPDRLYSALRLTSGMTLTGWAAVLLVVAARTSDDR